METSCEDSKKNLRSEMVSLCCNEEIFLHQEFHGIIGTYFLFLPYMQHFTPEVIIIRVNRKNLMARSPEGNHWATILSRVSSLKNRS